MSYTVVFHRLAIDEFVAACRSYALVSPNTENRFVAAIDAVLGRLSNYPKQGNPTVRGCRWMKPAKFPYIVHYREISTATIEIMAIAYGARRPSYWLRRTRRP